VITSVCRDDLEDQGAGHFASCVRAVKRRSPDTIIEVLIPDFRLDISCLESIIESGPEVLGHNIESVERLSPDVRDRRASYAQSLSVLRRIKEIRKDVYTKSAIMLGMGESEEEVLQALLDLRESGVDFLAMGQYLRPSQRHLEVKEYISPEKFARLGEQARKMGFLYVAAGPFVRSSYKAGEYFAKKLIRHGR
jgi:lipoic acid synthetase